MVLSYRVEKECCRYEAISEPHYHDEYEILLGLTDGGTFIINGHSYPLCHGMLFVLGQRIIHQCIANISSYEKYILHFPPETLAKLSTPQTDLQTLFANFDYISMLLNEDQLVVFRSAIERCISKEEGFGSDLERSTALVHLILSVSELLRSDSADKTSTPTRDYEKMRPILDFIHEHYAEDIGLEQLSRHFFISKYYLCRQFKSLTGFTVGAYITNYRIRQACILLRKGVSVQQTGEDVGFYNNAHFIRTFGKIIEMTPGKYAKTNRAFGATKVGGSG